MKVFLSYSHLDNVDPKGWVEAFHTELQNKTRVYAGEADLEIWRDRENRDYRLNNLDSIIKQGLSDSCLLVTLISPSYLNDRNEWGKFERSYFIEKVVGDDEKGRERIINVIKLLMNPKDVESFPVEMANNFRYSFCYAGQGNVPKTALPESEPFNEELTKIAHTIATQINHFRKPPPPPLLKVFMAKPSTDLAQKEVELKVEIEKVLDCKISFHTIDPVEDKAKWKESIRKALHESALSIHLVGAEPMKLYEYDSLERFQWEVATEYSMEKDFRVITWISKEALAKINGLGKENGHRLFLEDHIKNCTAKNHDFICSGPEVLKLVIRDFLQTKLE